MARKVVEEKEEKTLSLSDIIQQDKERIEAGRAELQAAIQEAQEKLSALDKELEAIETYVYVREHGRLPAVEKKAVRAPRQTDGKRAGRGERSASILQLVEANPDGLTRGQIIERFGGKEDKNLSSSISNALTNMVKGGKLGKKDRLYVLP